MTTRWRVRSLLDALHKNLLHTAQSVNVVTSKQGFILCVDDLGPQSVKSAPTSFLVALVGSMNCAVTIELRSWACRNIQTRHIRHHTRMQRVSRPWSLPSKACTVELWPWAHILSFIKVFIFSPGILSPLNERTNSSKFYWS